MELIVLTNKEKEKFWAYNKAAFSNQRNLVSNSPEVLAKSLKLNMKRFKNCLVHPETVRRINHARNLAQKRCRRDSNPLC